jgi:hypothetical protein
MLKRLVRRADLLAMTMMLAVPASVWAQATPPPQPTHSGKGWANAVGYVLIFVLLIAVVFVSLIPSKRGHQD